MPTLDDYMAEHPEAAPKPKHWHPEWSLQTKIKGFVREFCAVGHEFVAHDRAYDATGKQHIFEAERGVRRGWMDTELAIEGGITFRCELKWGRNKPSRDQERLIARMNVLGHPTCWTNSVVGYYTFAVAAGVRWHPNALARARFLDETLAAAFAKAPSPRKASKPARPRASARAIARGNRFHKR